MSACGPMDPADLTRIVNEVLAHAPRWVRSDLSSKDALLRARAEETLAAMICAALTESFAGADAV